MERHLYSRGSRLKVRGSVNSQPEDMRKDFSDNSYSSSWSSNDDTLVKKTEQTRNTTDNLSSAIDFVDNGNKSVQLSEHKSKCLSRDVLMSSALAAVMESNEDDVIWFDDADRKSLMAESIENARTRLARMKEISRSESSLFNEPGHLQKDDIDREKIETSKSNVKTESPCASKEDEERLSPVPLKRTTRLSADTFKKGHRRSRSDQLGIPKATAELEESDADLLNEDALSSSAPTAAAAKSPHEESGICFFSTNFKICLPRM